MAKACQLFSGSSGNSIFIADRGARFLVDAGVSAKRLELALNAIGEDARELTAIFVTHEHSDHINGLRVLAARHKIPVFAGEKVLSRLYRSGHVNEKILAEEMAEKRSGARSFMRTKNGRATSSTGSSESGVEL